MSDERGERSGDLARDTGVGVMWSNAAFFATRAMSFVAVVVLARLLDPSEFGLVAAVLVCLGVLELGSDLGMRSSVIYEQEHGVTKRVNTAFTVGLLIAASLTLVGVVLAPLISDLFRIDGLTPLLRLALLNIMLTSLGNVHDALLLRDMELRRRTTSEVVRGTVRAVVSVGLAFGGFGAASLVWGMLAGTAAWSATLWRLTRFVPSLVLDLRIARSMAGYGLGASALDALAAVTTRVDAVVIGRVLGERALGLYTIAFRVPELLVQSIAWNVSLVLFPALSRQRVMDPDSLERVTLAMTRYQALYALPMAAGLATLSAPLVEVLFGPKWQAASGVLAAVAVMTAITTLTFPLGDLLKAVGKQWILVLSNLMLIPLMVAAIILAASQGIVAVSWARVGSSALFAISVVLATSRALGVRSRGVAAAALPGLFAAGGVVVGAGAVRLAWPALSIGPLVTGAITGGAVASLVVRLLAPSTFGEVVAQVRALVAERTRRPVGSRAG